MKFATAADVRLAVKHMWHAANCAFSKTDRAAFNSWKRHMWKISDQLADESHCLPDEPRYENLCQLAGQMKRMVCEIPDMEE